MWRTLFSRSLFGSLVLCASVAAAISPEQVRQRLATGERITFLDVRPTALYKVSHIPNAINVPATLVPQKQLPPLGHVIVYDGGLGPDTAQSAAAALRLKKGISAEVLQGGFAAWEESGSSTTRPPGMTREELPMISYAQLKQTAPGDLLLIDLREPHRVAAGKPPEPPLTDLTAEFPGVRVAQALPQGPSGKAISSGSRPQPLLVLIDNGNGAAERVARALKASGSRRFAILAGGESILTRKGQPGLERLGTTVSPPRRQMAQPPNDIHN